MCEGKMFEIDDICPKTKNFIKKYLSHVNITNIITETCMNSLIVYLIGRKGIILLHH